MKLVHHLKIFILCVVLLLPGLVMAQPDFENLDLIGYDSVIMPHTPKMDFKELESGFFTENQGQWNSEFAFIADTSFGHIALGRGCAYFNYVEIQNDLEPISEQFDEIQLSGYVLKYVFESAQSVAPMGQEALQHRSNFFYGAEPKKWVTEVENYRSVIYNELWPSIDLRFYLNSAGPKYEFVLHPGANSDDIRIRVEGADELNLVDEELMLQLPNRRTIIDKDLTVFYADNYRDSINAKFEIIGKKMFSFNLAKYDNSRDLIIDPLVYSTYVSGSGWEHARAIDYDSTGNGYVTGFTLSSDFPNTTGAYDVTHNGNVDVFVFKIDPTGSSLVYSTFVGDSDSDYAYDISVDSAGNAFVTGKTNSNNFPTSTNPFDSSHNGNYDVFIFKLNPSGSSMVYSTFLGHSNYDSGNSITIDSNGYAYVTGNTSSSQFPTTASAYDQTYGGVTDVFIAKVNISGDKLMYSTFIGGSAGDNGFAIAIDTGGNAYITGYTDVFGTNYYPTTPGAYDTAGNSFEDVIVSKLNASGDKLLYSTLVAGSSVERGLGIDVDTNGYAYVAGWTRSTGFPTTTGAFQENYQGSTTYSEGFIFKLNITFDYLVYSTFLGDMHNDRIEGIDVDSSGAAYVTGPTGSTNFPVTPDAENGSHNGGIYDVFLTTMNASGNGLLYSTFRGGTGADYGYGVAISNNGDIYVAGVSSSTDFPTTPGAFSNTHKGNDDGIVFKFGFEPPLAPPENLKAVMGNGYVELDWEPPMGAPTISGYKIYRGTTSGGETLLDTIGDTTEYNDTTVTLGQIYYYYVTAYNVTTESGWSNEVLATDQVLPKFVVDNTPSTASTGDEFEFSAVVLDNILLASVEIEYWYGNNEKTNATMNNDDGNIWNYGITIEHTLDTLHYIFNATDIFNNYNVSSIRDILVIDNDHPHLGMDSSQGITSTGANCTFSIEVTDNIEVDSVWIEYWLGEGVHTNSSMTADASNTWIYEITLPDDNIGPLHYIFHANDTSNNWNETAIVDVPVLDNIMPSFGWDYTSEPANTGDSFRFLVEVFDNIEVHSVWVEYWYGDGPHYDISLRKASFPLWINYITVMDTFDLIHYIFHVNDTSGNWNSTNEELIVVRDNDEPIIGNNTSPTSAATDDSYNLSIEVTDNLKVHNVSAEYWFGVGSRLSIFLEFSNGYYIGTIEIPINTVETLHYIIETYDTFNNYNTTGVIDVQIIDNIPPIIKSIADLTITQGETIDISMDANDNIGLTEIVWEGAPIPSSNYKLSGVVDTVGKYNIKVTIKDEAGNSASTTFTLTVLAKDLDSDTDGIPDIIELTYGLNPNSAADANDDLDSDGLTNLEEFLQGTNLSNTDTDADGMPDGWETKNKLDPLTPSADNDEDGDGKSDLEEYLDNTNPLKKEDTSEDESQMVLIVAIIVIVVIIILIIIFLLIHKKKKQLEPVETDTAQVQESEVETTSPEQPPSTGMVDGEQGQYPQYPQYPQFPQDTSQTTMEQMPQQEYQQPSPDIYQPPHETQTYMETQPIPLEQQTVQATSSQYPEYEQYQPETMPQMPTQVQGLEQVPKIDEPQQLDQSVPTEDSSLSQTQKPPPMLLPKEENE